MESQFLSVGSSTVNIYNIAAVCYNYGCSFLPLHKSGTAKKTNKLFFYPIFNIYIEKVFLAWRLYSTVLDKKK
jgi:hypothetical protein